MKNKNIRVPYALAVYGDEEIAAVNRVLKDPIRIVAGTAVKKFEAKIAALFGKKYGIMVNSGSSANLLALELLNLPRGSEVITPVLTFSTTVAPMVQKGLVPVFADVVLGSYQIDIEQIPKLITKKTKALMIPSLIGNLPDYRKLSAIANKFNLWLIEDSCDTLGATLFGKPTGFYSDISTTSFYASHIITAGGGGAMLCVNDAALARRALVMANWGRESTLFGSYGKGEVLQKRMAGRINGKPYDAKFIFSEIGYNFQSNEIAGAFGLEQLKRLKTFSAARKRNFKRLLGFFRKYEDFFILPTQHKGAKTAWLSLTLLLKDGAPFRREELVGFLEKQNIQTRPIFTGNILRQPAFRKITRRTLPGGYPAADLITRGSLLIGAHHGLTEEMIRHLFESFSAFLKKHTRA